MPRPEAGAVNQSQTIKAQYGAPKLEPIKDFTAIIGISLPIGTVFDDQEGEL